MNVNKESRQMLIKCPDCGKKYYLSVLEPLLDKKVRVRCINSYCQSNILQSIPAKSVWGSRKILYTINPQVLTIKYYDSRNEIQEFIWSKNTLLIGRNPKENRGIDVLKIQDSSVSSTHCILGTRWDIVSQTAVYRIKDLGSTNGTYINGRKLASNVKYDLSDRDLILGGSFQLLFSVK